MSPSPYTPLPFNLTAGSPPLHVPFPYTPFPFNVTPASPLFHLSPLASDTSPGWIPSCTTQECISNAIWFTSGINSTLSFQYWGWDVAFEGYIRGNMSVELFRDGVQETWNPSGDTLFSLKGGSADQFYQHNITLRVVDASPLSQLRITQAQVNGTLFTDNDGPWTQWTVPSSDDRLSYTGFAQQNSATANESSSTYVSSVVGDTVSMQFNGSAFLFYGPCGPSSGLMTVTVDGRQQTVNTSKPFASDDCLLFQSWGMSAASQHDLVIANTEGKSLGINRFEIFTFLNRADGSDHKIRDIVIACAVVGAVVTVLSTVAIILYVKRARKKKQEAGGPHGAGGWLKLLG